MSSLSQTIDAAVDVSLVHSLVSAPATPLDDPSAALAAQAGVAGHVVKGGAGSNSVRRRARSRPVSPSRVAGSTVEQDALHASVQTLTLARLVRSSLNVRRRDSDLGELVSLIRSYGLLQNLVGYTQVIDGAATGIVEIVAGGRRLESLAMLIADGTFPEDYGVPVLIVTEAEAIELSLAENRGRSDMHPADVYTAMLALTGRGRSIEDIALGFHLEVLTVRRCLKLAKLSPRLLELYRSDAANFEQMMALAISDDHAVQEQAWDSLDPHRRSAHELRRLLTNQHISVKNDRVARFVGIEAFESAGGVITRDLFSDTGAGYIADAGLLERLAMAKLLSYGDELANNDGYPWVDILPRADYATLAEYAAVRTVRNALSEAQQVKVAELRTQVAQLEERIAECDEDADDIFDALAAQVTQLEGERDAIEASCLLRAIPEDKELAGAVVTLDDAGNIVVKRDVIRPHDKGKMITLRGAQNESTARRKKALHSDRLTYVLTSHRTAALQAELVERPDIALVVLTHTLLSNLVRPHCNTALAAKLSLTAPVLADEVNTSPAAMRFLARREELMASLPAGKDGDDWLAWLHMQPQETVLQVLALCVASSLDTTQTREGACPAFTVLACALNLDMCQWWTPTAASYFSHLPKDRIGDVVTDAASSEAAVPLQKMKKSAAADAAERALVGMRWLPEPLRTQQGN